MADFEPPTINLNRIAAWFAFYGEAKSRPTYMKACSEMDRATFDTIVELCRTIIEEGGYPNLNPLRVAEGLSAMTDGLWLDILISPHDSTPESSIQTIRTYLRAIFPNHFPIARRAGD